MNLLSLEENDIILSYLKPSDYEGIDKFLNEHSKDRKNKYSNIIIRNFRSFIIQKKIITKKLPVTNLNSGIYSNYNVYRQLSNCPLYSKIYLKKFYPRKLISGALIFYASNINRYELEFEENDILKMIIFTVFYMKADCIDKLNEILRLLPKNKYIKLYEAFIKFKVLKLNYN
jgi:hypothetical protein